MTPLFKRFSSKENLEKAFKYVKKELEKSNIPAFPLNNSGISAIETLGDEYFKALEKLIRSGAYEAEKTFFIYFPKDNLDVRPVKVLSVTDRIVFQAILNPEILGLHIDDQLEDTCIGNRVDRQNTTHFLRPYEPLWDLYNEKQLQVFKTGKKWRIEIDISKFFENIFIPKLCQKLEAEFGVPRDLTSFLDKMLMRWCENDLPKGIPQGPNASWVLAHAYFDETDKFILKKTRENELEYFRYADDMVFMAAEKKGLADFVREVALHVRQDNLSLNEKTAIKQIKTKIEIEESAFGVSEEFDDRNQNEGRAFLTIITPDEAKEIIYKILGGEKVTKKELSNLKFFLSVYHGPIEVDFLDSLLEALFIRPSLFNHGIKFIGSSINQPNRKFYKRNKFVYKIVSILTEERCDKYLCVWLLKLAVESSKNDMIFRVGIKGYVSKILRSSNEIQEVITALYYYANLGQKLNYKTFLNLEDRFDGYKKSLILSFITILSDEDRRKIATRVINSLIRNTSNEANLIGLFLKKIIKPELQISGSRESIVSYLTKASKDEHDVSSPIIEIPKGYVMIAEKHLLYARLGTKQNREYSSKKLKSDVYIIKKHGKYHFDGNPVYIKSLNAQYTTIFDVAFSLKPNGGKVFYKDIIEICEKRKCHINKKAILRALTGKDANLFKYVRGFVQEPANKVSLFVPMQNGEEIEFNNKK